MNSPAAWQGKRIAILGAGREGQAVYRHLRNCLPTTPVCVLAESAADEAFVGEMRAGDSLHVAPLTAERLCGFDVLVRSPGISIYRQPLKAAQAAGVHITTPTSLWFELHGGDRVLCITGTKGKSTTASLVAHMLSACGLRVNLAGNIGRPLLACEADDADWWVVELSSYQLADLQASPRLGMVLNVSPEHLDWHQGEANYTRDKLRLAQLVQAGGLMLNAADPVLRRQFDDLPDVTWFNQPPLMYCKDGRFFHHDMELPVTMPAGLPGKHNQSNVVAALTAAWRAGADPLLAARAVASFASLPHRLQYLGQQDGVDYINDSIASAPVATLAALEALHGRRIILLAGGLDRGIDWSGHAEAMSSAGLKAVIGLPANGPRIVELLRRSGGLAEHACHVVDDLQQAVALARQLAEPGDLILLSPGAPSFPQFVDYRDRGQRFAVLSGFDALPE